MTPTVKFVLRDEVMKKALEIKEKMGLTWKEVALQGLGMVMEPTKVGRPPKKEKTDISKEEDKIERQIMDVALKTFHEIAVWRDFLFIRDLDDAGWLYYKYHVELPSTSTQDDDVSLYTMTETTIPIIDKSFSVFKNGRLNVLDIQLAAMSIAIEEGKLVLTGEHEGWNALEVKGFVTIDGINTMESCGCWPKNVLTDIVQARNNFKPKDPIILIASTEIINSLDNIMWEDPDGSIPPITYKNFLLEQKIVSNIYETDALFAKNGVQNNALILTPKKENIYIAQAMGLDAVTFTTRIGEVRCVLREAVAPAIPKPHTIIQITDIEVTIPKS